ncbi:NADH dehydrogenase subunit 5 (mitochondrion) [Branchiostoma lanceolatum]|uniref:NADH-ubiquinone oxidoreductase chain 5 n=1 Tax=Branchiostoma lanceolatum TaxID=7740 RepID=NU5M_BRALA|nr:NADH dehydrogenase subunit 5 [Branchiostoma lanceolatum]O79422.1 RecName: Full=NADH-ubiquinone oxidoreductase chain 5; AltName: Full=NADH dehydrogenase subunit 5 [Branchiostoma lanceolatum]CAA76257.1 NADH dehydrogenase subunit 5 [Branchiostoma lanceolatum]
MLELWGVLSLTSLGVMVIFLFSKIKSSFAESVKYAGYMNAVLLSILLMSDESEMLFLKWEWVKLGGYSLMISFRFDLYTCCFFVVGLYVTWNILMFSFYYMSTDPRIDLFCKYLGLFLIAMLLLVSAESLFQLLIGWEGVGIMSYLLISWWYARSDANTAALQAIFYNRVGDIGLLIMLMWSLVTLGDWSFTGLYALDFVNTFFLLGVVLAAAGKSAQLGLHPWLPAAMEGPTPVSSLLHSSTMVVAGVFLLIRFSPIILNHKEIQLMVFFLGTMTTLFSAICALAQNDMKKVVAFSTASQLGLMVTAVGAGAPQLAFLHICMHAFFKAMLFMCSGSFIHGLQNEQDVRKMGGLYSAAPITSVCFFIGSAALMGVPFLAGFFSKDPIIEIININNLNSWAVGLVLIATSFTAAYSVRLLYFSVGGVSRMLVLQPMNEEYGNLIGPLQRLAYSSVIAGVVFIYFLSPNQISCLSLPLSLKLAAVFVTLVGGLIAWDVVNLLHREESVTNIPELAFEAQVGFYPLIMHKLIPKVWLNMGEMYQMQVMDRGWTELALPQGLGGNYKIMADNVVNAQTSLIKMYIAVMVMMGGLILGIMICL